MIGHRILRSMPIRRRTLVRVACFIFGAIALINFCNGITIFIDSLKSRSIFNLFSKHYPSKETLEDLSLTEQQCRATFPGLMKEIDDSVARGPFNLEKEPDDYTGMVQLRIKDGKVTIQNSSPSKSVRIDS
jgi:hypothetical protein